MSCDFETCNSHVMTQCITCTCTFVVLHKLLMTTIKITAEYHDLHCISLVQITHVKKAKFVCSLLRSVRYGQVAQPCILHCGTETGFHSSRSRNRLFGHCAGCWVSKKKLADRNICSDLITSIRSGIIGYFYNNNNLHLYSAHPIYGFVKFINNP